ncbi:MAG: hypothetical protein DDT42_01900 [candidate division WS2 bacterium]|uniref:Uncharacterized protein n=1 Tax=Psychracetigena formicireducens TaxID=2986056 RepID=A0A9E2F5B4_PSYF1|nr:hypothetical protein [Candidatus Psychracetigena formicireducens]
MEKMINNRSLLCRIYGISRSSTIEWENKGQIYDELAKRGIAIYPSRVERISGAVNSVKFDDLTKFPPRKLVEAEKEWLRTAYSWPDGPIQDPRPRAGAPKGVYYDEKKTRWFPRPYVKIPG